MEKKEIIRKSVLVLGLGASIAGGYETFFSIEEPPRVEIIELRQETSKTYALPDLIDGKPHYVSAFIQEPLHYQDQQGKWQDIELDFLAVGTSTFKNSRNKFNVYVPKKFTDIQQSCLSGKCVYWTPVGANPALVEFLTERTPTYFRKTASDDALYRNAWQGTDVQYRNEWYGLKEKIIVKDATAPTSFSFRFSLKGLVKKSHTNAMKFENGDDAIYVREITAFDAKNRQVPITTTQNTNTFTISYNPTGFTYPIEIDPVSQFNPPSGNSDGAVLDAASNTWEAMRTGAGTAANSTETNENAIIRRSAAGTFIFTNQISWAFDTGAVIPSTAVINDTASTSLALFVNEGDTCIINDNDTEAYFSIVKHLRAATSTISTSDYKKFLMTDGTEVVVADVGLATGSGSTTISSLDAMGTNAWHVFDLNLTGISWIGKGTMGSTTLSLLEGHYIEDKPITLAANQQNSCNFQMVENTNDPLLEVDWTAAAVGGKPTRKIIIIGWLEKLFNIAYAND